MAKYGSHSITARFYGSFPVIATCRGAQKIWPVRTDIVVPTDEWRWSDFAPVVLAPIDAPADTWAWIDFAPRVNDRSYAFSRGFSQGFRAQPVASPLLAPADLSSWIDYAPFIKAGPNVRVPVDEWSWEDRAPSIGQPTSYSFTMTAEEYGEGIFVGFSGGAIDGLPAFGSIVEQPAPPVLAVYSAYFGVAGIAVEGDMVSAWTGKTVWVNDVEYPFDYADWDYDSENNATFGQWGPAGPSIEDGLTYVVEIK